MEDEIRLPSWWATAAAKTAALIPEIVAVYFYGSRVTNVSRHGRACQLSSDLDIALVMDGDDEDERCGNAIWLAPRFQNLLASALDHAVRLHVQSVGEDDEIVGPAVRDHGRLIYQRPPAAQEVAS